MLIRFLGAAGTVTGSRFLVEAGGTRVLVDAGLFQGPKALRERNWAPFPVDPASVDAVVLTHAHLDHSGWVPRLVAQGFRGPVLANAATADLVRLLWLDAGRIAEEDAAYAEARGFSKHLPPLPLYTERQAEIALRQLQVVGTEAAAGVLRFRFYPAGHILGASSVVVDDGAQRVLFSGDLGRSDDLFLPPPQPPTEAVDLVVMESTYGDRRHERVDPLDALEAVIRRTIERKGVVLVPAFAVGRAQALLLALTRLQRAGRIPQDLPLILNSPMAVETLDLYRRHAEAHRITLDELGEIQRRVRLVRSVEESKALNRLEGPAVIVSASGMLTGGRVLHHLRTLAPDPRNTVLLVGYQAVGTRGAALQEGVEEIKLHGRFVPIRCEVARLASWSAHADQEELLSWLRALPGAPAPVVLVHGEPRALETLRVLVPARTGRAATVAEADQVRALGGAPPAPAPVASSRPAEAPRPPRAVEDAALLARDELLAVRLLLEVQQVELALVDAGVAHTLVVFGSARLVAEASPGPLPAGDLLREAEALGRLSAERLVPRFGRLVVCTGGGGGIMAAANRGAQLAGARSMGLNIDLPREQEPNRWITPGLCFQLSFFGARKLHFLRRARALVAFPGGFGTLDEVTDALTLIQTGKMDRIPVVLVHRAFWSEVLPLARLAALGLIGPADPALVRYAESAEEAWQAVVSFYEGEAAPV